MNEHQHSVTTAMDSDEAIKADINAEIVRLFKMRFPTLDCPHVEICQDEVNGLKTGYYLDVSDASWKQQIARAIYRMGGSTLEPRELPYCEGQIRYRWGSLEELLVAARDTKMLPQVKEFGR